MHSANPLRRFALCLLLGWSFGSVAAAEDPWPRFRGPSGDGTAAADAELPLRWGPDENILWRCELPGEGWSSPVVGDKRVYLTAAIPDAKGEEGDLDLSLLMIDTESGKLIRTVKLLDQSAADAPAIHSKNSHASPTAELSAERVFVHFGHQGTAATDRRGEIAWSNRELRYRPVHGNGGSPLLVGDRLVIAYDGGEDPFVAALDARTGEVLWRTPRPVESSRSFSFCTPTAIEVGGRTQVIVPGSDCVTAHDPEDGKILWYARYDGYSVVPKPLYAGGLIFLSTGYGPTEVLAIRPTGSGDVTDTHIAWRLDRGAPKTPSMVADEELLYVLSDDGILTTLELESGEVVYRKRIGGAYSASPVLAAGRLYLVSEQGIATVIRSGRKFEPLAENDLGERTLASPAIVGNTIFLRTAKALYRIGG
ncbi:PQQ-binding-like beta-propeller repeat protein [Candidatus Laterigemmans baculatus]|uniref:PQQ-binding-like beta-propeller repeat protein n=1 Tax=Candidatus Laterigemmans baculatus TaxID=2770505 RepID=UPI0013DD36E8|nr:PQQ-binding-like beta-propeller repeat protein [Candidatus Laterigemmans baculatus]